MAPPSQSTIEKKLALLQANFKSTLPAKVDEIELLWNSISINDVEQSVISDCHRMTHTLVGSGGTFGAVVVSTVARELEQALKLLIEEKTVLTSEYKSIVSSLILKLKRIKLLSEIKFEENTALYITNSINTVLGCYSTE